MPRRLVLALSVACFALLGCARAAADRRSDIAPDDASSAALSAFVAVVGHWTPVHDGGAAFKADGETWSGTTERSHLERVARSIFASPVDDFIANGTAEGAFPLAVFDDVRDFSTGTIRVRFKLLGGRSDQNAGIVFGLQPGGEYLFVRYNTKDGDVALWEYSNGKRRVLAHGTTKAKLPLERWHELAVTVSASRVTGAVNGGSLTVEHTLVAPPTGRVGLWTKRDAITVFRDFRVTR